MIADTRLLSLVLAAAALAACADGPAEPQDHLPGPVLATASPGTWTTKAAFPTPRYRLASAVLQNAAGQYSLYTIGGENAGNPAMKRVQAYNAATNTWSRKADLPFKRANTNGAAVIGGKIYLTGGSDELFVRRRTLYVYNAASDSWTRGADLPVRSNLGVTGVIGGKLYVLTGDCADCIPRQSRRLYRYDPATNRWSRKRDAPHSHVGGIGGVIDGMFYVAWGARPGGNTLEVYDPSLDRWKTRLHMDYDGQADSTVQGAAGAVLDKKLYVIGGLAGDETSSIVKAYDPLTNRWTSRPYINVPRISAVAGTVKKSAGKLQIVVAGGSPTGLLQASEDGPSFTSVTEAYTP